MTRTLTQELDDMHASYVESVNHAIDQDDMIRAEELAASYDDEAITLVAEREGKTHLLPISRGPAPDSRLRRLVGRLSTARAA